MRSHLSRLHADWLPAGSLRRRLASAAFWSIMSTGIAQASTLAVSVVTARILGPVGFGELAIVSSTMGSLGVFAGLGLGLTSTKYVAELRVSDPVRAGLILGLVNRAVLVSGVLIAAVLFVLAPMLAASVLNAPGLTTQLRIGCLLMLFNEINGVQIGSLAGYEAFRPIARVNLVRGLAGLPIGIAGAQLYGVYGAVVAMVMVAAIGMVLSHVALEREARRWGIRITTRGARREVSVLWRFSLPAFLGSVVVGPAGWIGNALLVNQPGGYAQLGLFNAANQWRTMVMFFPTVVGQAALPILSSLAGSADTKSTRRVLLATIAGSAGVAVPIAAVMIAANGLIMGFYGPGFAPHGDILVVVGVTVVMLAIQAPIGQLIAASGRMWLGATMNLAWSAVFIVSALALLALGLGALGLAFAYLVAYSLNSLWTLWFGFNVVRVPPRVEALAEIGAAESSAPRP
jgi:O-antigen/teichoic acid export membrane protein